MGEISSEELSLYLDGLLEHDRVSDVAVNGLQFPGGKQVRRLGAAVDAHLPVLREACRRDIDFLIVHHGLFWSYQRPALIQPVQKEIYRVLTKNDLSLYASHLPLDRHPEVGNNQTLLADLGLGAEGGFFELDGVEIGLFSDDTVELTMDELHQRLSEIIPLPELRYYLFSRDWEINSRAIWENGESVVPDCWWPAREENSPLADTLVGRLGVVTGGGSDALRDCPARGIRTLLTGEAPHYAVNQARELGVNLLLAGHYQTEKGGVRALCEHLAKKFNLDWEFIDYPTGL